MILQLTGSVLAVILFLGTLHAAGRCEHDTKAFRCVDFVENYDADTITVNIPNVHSMLGDKAKIRVNGIDTPEKAPRRCRINDPKGCEARRACEVERAKVGQALVAKILSKAKHIDLTNVQRGKYFRIVANVIADQQSISQVLLAAKLAVPYDGGTKTVVDWCAVGAK